MTEKESIPESDKEKTPEPKEEPAPPAKPEKKSNEPPPNSPRFNEIYGRMKFYERENEEVKKDMDALTQHAQEMTRKFEELKKQMNMPRPAEAPDPTEDLQGYIKWRDLQDLERDKKREEERRIDRLNTMIDVEKSIHPDYEEMAAIADKNMLRDPKLKNEIWGKPNPARAAYEYGLKFKKDLQKSIEDENGRQQDMDKLSPEPPANTPPDADEDKDKLTDEQVRIIKKMYKDLPFEKAKERYLNAKKPMDYSFLMGGK